MPYMCSACCGFGVVVLSPVLCLAGFLGLRLSLSLDGPLVQLFGMLARGPSLQWILVALMVFGRGGGAAASRARAVRHLRAVLLPGPPLRLGALCW